MTKRADFLDCINKLQLIFNPADNKQSLVIILKARM